MQRNKIVDINYVRKWLPRRTSRANKTAGGKCLILAGSKGLWGAALLCAEAASRIGAGYVYIPENIPSSPPDFLTLKKSPQTNFSAFSSVAFGPGLKVDKINGLTLKHLIHSLQKNVVLDASAFELLVKNKAHKLPPTWIITPHEGELALLLNTTSKTIRNNRLQAVKKAQKVYGCIVVLKGHNTLVATQKVTYQIKQGNKALAKAGTGDVLTGMISGFLSQGLDNLHAALLACTLHGYMADRWVKNNDYLSLMPRDLLDTIPKTLHDLR